jgi:hypothetical protein
VGCLSLNLSGNAPVALYILNMADLKIRAAKFKSERGNSQIRDSKTGAAFKSPGKIAVTKCQTQMQRCTLYL